MGRAVERRNSHVAGVLSRHVSSPRDVVLDIGAGVLRKGRLAPCGHYLATDIRPLPGLDAVADATQLPFRTASVQAVLGLELLEHVPRPGAVLHEAARVLTRSGVALFSVPSVFPRHDAHDYWRFTPMGLRQLADGIFADVEVLTFGHTFETLAVLGGYYLQLATTRRARALESLVPILERAGERLDRRIPWASSQDGLHTLQSDLLLIARTPLHQAGPA